MTIQFMSVTTNELAKYLDYRDQPGLVRQNSCGIVFTGKHSDHTLTRTDDGWTCDCRSFQNLGWCCHVKVLRYQQDHAFPILNHGCSDKPAELPANFIQAALAGA